MLQRERDVCIIVRRLLDPDAAAAALVCVAEEAAAELATDMREKCRAEPKPSRADTNSRAASFSIYCHIRACSYMFFFSRACVSPFELFFFLFLKCDHSRVELVAFCIFNCSKAVCELNTCHFPGEDDKQFGENWTTILWHTTLLLYIRRRSSRQKLQNLGKAGVLEDITTRPREKNRKNFNRNQGNLIWYATV